MHLKLADDVVHMHLHRMLRQIHFCRDNLVLQAVRHQLEDFAFAVGQHPCRVSVGFVGTAVLVAAGQQTARGRAWTDDTGKILASIQ
ncbi:hypothetical protein D3C86_2117780 [compost metagenome]